MTAPSTTPRLYFPALDGLRGAALLLVFFAHLAMVPSAPLAVEFIHDMGWFGVELFFAICGFIFIVLLCEEHRRTGSISLRNFFARRALRIIPAYYAYVLVHGILVLTGFFPGPLTWRTASILLFFENYLTAFYGGPPPGIIVHLWTVAYEVQLYILLPFICMLLFSTRAKFGAFIAAAAIVLALMLTARLMLPPYFPQLGLGDWAVYIIPFFSCDSFIAGLLAGYAYSTGRIPRWFSGIAFLLGIMLSGAVFYAGLPTRNWDEVFHSFKGTWIFSYFAIICFLLLTGITSPSSWGRRILSLRPFVFLGKYSYGFYLYHCAVLYIVTPSLVAYVTGTAVVPVHWMLNLAISMPLCTIIALVSYYAVERRFLLIKERFTLVTNKTA